MKFGGAVISTDLLNLLLRTPRMYVCMYVRRRVCATANPTTSHHEMIHEPVLRVDLIFSVLRGHEGKKNQWHVIFFNLVANNYNNTTL